MINIYYNEKIKNVRQGRAVAWIQTGKLTYIGLTLYPYEPNRSRLNKFNKIRKTAFFILEVPLKCTQLGRGGGSYSPPQDNRHGNGRLLLTVSCMSGMSLAY